MPAFRNNECVRVHTEDMGALEAVYATIVCSLDYKRDDIEDTDTGAVVLLFPDFRDDNDNGLREVSMSDLRKQYDI